jgi:hypothetical protein
MIFTERVGDESHHNPEASASDEARITPALVRKLARFDLKCVCRVLLRLGFD